MEIKKFKVGNYHAEVTAILGDSGVKFEAKPAVVICPGGSYMYVSKREAEPIAYDFLAQGYQVFILRYSTIGTMIEQEGRTAERDEMFWRDYAARLRLLLIEAGLEPPEWPGTDAK